jgi:hypothetical protein
MTTHPPGHREVHTRQRANGEKSTLRVTSVGFSRGGAICANKAL